MCYGDIAHGSDGYYEEWAQAQEEEAQLQQEQEQQWIEEQGSRE
jgi:hypothetical protein